MAKRNSIESYILRIYRRGEGDSTNFVGVVEDPCTSAIRPFHSRDELMDILGGARWGQRPDDAGKTTGGKN